MHISSIWMEFDVAHSARLPRVVVDGDVDVLDGAVLAEDVAEFAGVRIVRHVGDEERETLVAARIAHLPFRTAVLVVVR